MAASAQPAEDIEKQLLIKSSKPPLGANVALSKKEASTRTKPSVHMHLVGHRGFLALVVVFVHLADSIMSNLPDHPIIDRLALRRLRCHRAIVLFFILSSFQLTLGLLEKVSAAEQHIGWRAVVQQWGDYSLRRVFRIYPPFVVILLFLKFFPRLGEGHFSGSREGPKNLWRLLTMRERGPGLGMFWTLPSELEYYLVIPVLVTVYKWGEAADARRAQEKQLPLGEEGCERSCQPGWLFQALSIAPFAALALAQPYIYSTSTALAEPFSHPHLPHFFCVFFAGSAAAVVVYNLNKPSPCRRPPFTLPPADLLLDSSAKQRLPADAQCFADAIPHRRLRLLVAYSWGAFRARFALYRSAALFVTVWAVFGVSYDFQRLFTHGPDRMPDLPYVACCLGVVFLSSAWPQEMIGSFNWVFGSWPARRIGAMSYSVYLWHPVSVRLVCDRVWPATRSVELIVVCVYLVALFFGYVGQRYVETPFMQLSSWVSKRVFGRLIALSTKGR